MKLTLKKLRAMEAALNIILAGEEGEGDAAGTPFSDFEAALDWVQAQIARRM